MKKTAKQWFEMFPEPTEAQKLLPKKLRDIVRQVLMDNKFTRDCDAKLMFYVWQTQDETIQMESHLSDVLTKVSDNKLFNPEQIRRTRQRLQEKYPELRGSAYVERQKKGRQVTETINKLENE